MPVHNAAVRCVLLSARSFPKWNTPAVGEAPWRNSLNVAPDLKDSSHVDALSEAASVIEDHEC